MFYWIFINIKGIGELFFLLVVFVYFVLREVVLVVWEVNGLFGNCCLECLVILERIWMVCVGFIVDRVNRILVFMELMYVYIIL